MLASSSVHCAKAALAALVAHFVGCVERPPLEVPGQTGMIVRELPGRTWVVSSEPWSANSLLVETRGGPLILVDTPTTPEDTRLLVNALDSRFGRRELVVFNSHYHLDAVGGNEVVAGRARIIATERTRSLLASRGPQLVREVRRRVKPLTAQRIAEMTLTPPNEIVSGDRGAALEIGGERVEVVFPGAAHSPDNIVVWFPERRLLYGGCMIKGGPSLRNVSEAEFSSWLRALDTVAALEPATLIPGHGSRTDPGMIENTRQLVRAALAEARLQ